MSDTIAAISTALGVGAISIVRVSGDDAINIVNQVFKGKELTKVDTHTISYGYIIDNDNIIDEVLVSVMKAPRTFTKEDVVEINCHGGIATTKKILELLLTKGCRLAEPGEFTKRAFLNGRIDLIEADGIMNLISAKTDKARDIAIRKVNGKVTKLIRDLRSDLVAIISNIEVNIDYPEYEDIEIITNQKLKSDIIFFQEKLLDILKYASDGKLINEGINVGIIGRPNVGKSSLLNMLLEEDKAIVTDIEGTTRDIVEGTIILEGLLLNIIDTAGIRKTDNIVEKIGVEKSLEIINKSDLVLLVLNNNEPLTEEDTNLLRMIKDKPHLIIINKIDLENKLSLDTSSEVVRISAKNNLGLEELTTKIKEIFNLEQLENQDLTYLTNSREISLIKKCQNNIEQALNYIDNNAPIDIIEIELKNAWNSLGEIIGETYTDELIDEIFKRFCLGK